MRYPEGATGGGGINETTEFDSGRFHRFHYSSVERSWQDMARICGVWGNWYAREHLSLQDQEYHVASRKGEGGRWKGGPCGGKKHQPGHVF